MGHGYAVIPPGTSGKLPAYAFVNESQSLHLLWVEEIAAVKQDRMGERFPNAFEVQLFEFFPFGGHDESIAAVSDVVHVFDKSNVLKQAPGFVHGFGIVNSQDCPLLL